MAVCTWTSINRYVDGADAATSSACNSKAPGYMLYDRMLNVFGWSDELRKTLAPGRDGVQRLTFRLNINDVRSTRFILHCMIDKTKFPHQCAECVFESASNGEYEAAIKISKAEVIKKVRDLSRYIIPTAQGPPVSSDGDLQQVTKEAENTQVTEDVVLEENVQTFSTEDLIATTASTEKVHCFDDLLNRWVPLSNITIDGTTSWPSATYSFPEDLYKLACIPNTLPMEQFMYGDYDIEVMLKVNSNKFQAGRLILSVVPAPIALSSKYTTSWYNAVQRTHAFVDVAAATAAIVRVPFEYNRAYVRNIEHGQNCAGVDGAVYGKVELGVASPIVVGSGQTKAVTCLVWVRIRKAHMAGMALRIPIAQGPIMRPAKPFLEMLKAVDLAAETIITGDLDKPTLLHKTSQVTPNPSFGWCNAKSTTYCDVLRADQSAKMAFPTRCMESVKHSSLYDIARQWGYLTTLTWSVNADAGTALLNIPLEPAFWSNQMENTIQFAYTIPPPVSAVARMAQYYTGTFEFRIEFVSTMFHSGSVTVSLEYGRESTTGDSCAPYASYNMTFDLGETKIMEFTVPYIYDTPYRRTNTVPYYAHVALTDPTAINKYRTGLVMRVNSKVYIRVANPLRAPSTVANVISGLVYVRAGKDWRVLNIIQNNAILESGETVDTLPSDSYQPIVVARSRRDTNNGHTIKQESHRGMGLGDVHKMIMDKKVSKIKTLALEECQTRGEASEALQAEVEQNKLDIQEKSKEIAQLMEKLKVAEAKASNVTTSEQCEIQKRKNEVEAHTWSKILEHKWASGFAKPTQTDINFWKTRVNRLLEENVSRFPHMFIAVDNQYLAQKVDVPGISPVHVGSEAWYRALNYNILARSVQWEPQERFPRAQGPGDSSQKVDHFFSPRDGDPTQIAITSSEMCIWDILKRPVMIQSGSKIEAFVPYFIPVLPPQWTYINTEATPFMDIVKTSPHVGILSQFRFWRGETRYTIINRSKENLYIAYIPHSGVRIIGSWKVIGTNDTAFKKEHIMGTGNIFTVNIPSVNPMTQVEVPSMTENLWIPMNNGGLVENKYWRDKCDDNAGHIVIWADAEAIVDIFWAAGDSFRCGAYLGNIGAQRMRLVDTMTDDNPRAQDFHSEEGKSIQEVPSAQMWSYFTRVLPNKAEIAFTSVAEASAKICEGVEKANVLTDVARDFVMGKTEQCCEKITKAIDDMLATWGNSQMKASVVSLTLDLWLAWKSWDITVISTLVAKWIISVGIVSWSMLIQLVEIIKEWLSVVTRPCAQDLGGSFYKKFFGSLIQMSTVYKSSTHGGRLGRIVDRLVEYTGFMKAVWYVRTWKAFSEFLECLVKMIGGLWKWLMCETDPETAIITAMTERNTMFLNYVTDLNYFLHPATKKELTMYPSKRIRFYATVAMSYKIQAVLQAHPEMREFQHLGASIRQLCIKATEYSEELMTSPVRYEPYVVCLAGGTNIGKSFYANRLANQLMKQIGYNDYGDTVYVRTPGRDYWDGYTGQPVVIFDDMSNINEPGVNVSTIADLFALKSSAVFIPNMAHLEKKNMRGNPLVILILTNKPFPELPEAAHVEAFDRRRDEMHRVSALNTEKLENSDHLQFEQYKSVRRSPTGTYEFEPLQTREEFESALIARFRAYHVKEQGNVKQRLAAFFSAMKTPGELDLLEYDPYAIVYRALFTSQEIGSSSGLFESMDEMFGNYLNKIDLESVEDYYEKGREVPVAQENSDERKFFESFTELTDDGGNHRAQLVDFLSQFGREELSQLSYVKKLFHAFFGTHAIYSESLRDRLLKFIRSYTGFDTGRCTYCGLGATLVYKAFCSTPSCEDQAICATCVIAGRHEYCECGMFDMSQLDLTLKQTFWAIVYHLARLFTLPPVLVVYGLYYCYTTIPSYIEGYAGLLGVMGIISAIQLNWIISVPSLTISYLLFKWVSPTRADAMKKTTQSMYYYAKEMVLRTGMLSYRVVEKLFRKKKERRTLEEELNFPEAQAVDPSETIIRPGKEVSYSKLWDPKELGIERACAHCDLLKPVRAILLTEAIHWRGKICTSREVVWNRGHWEVCDDEGEIITIENGYCSHTDCPLRDIDIVNFLLAKILSVDSFRCATQSRLAYNVDLNLVPVQMLTETQWETQQKGLKPMLRRVYNYIVQLGQSDWITYLKEKSTKGWTKTVWWIILGGSVIVLVVKAIIKFINLFTGDEEEGITIEEQSPQAGSQRSPNRSTNRVRRAYNIVKGRDNKPQAQGLDDNINSIIAVVYQNIVIMKVDTGCKDIELVGLGVRQNCVLMPAHFFKHLELAHDLQRPVKIKRLQGSEAWYTATVRMDRIRRSDNSDIMLWDIEVLPPFRDIIKHYPDDNFIATHQMKGSGYILVPAVGPFVKPILHAVTLKEYVNNTKVINSNGVGHFNILNGVTYNFSCPGACGSPILRAVNNKPILGFHSAGIGVAEKGTGWGTIVSSGDLITMIDSLLPVAQQMSEYMEIPNLICHDGKGVVFPDECVGLELGAMPPNKSLVQPRKTRLTESAIAQALQIEPRRIPCPLTGEEPPYIGTGTTPLIEGIKHYGHPPTDLPSDFEQVTEPIMTVLLGSMKPEGLYQRKPLTIKEAVVGVPELEYYDAINVSSSAGYPWNLEYKDGKKSLMNLDPYWIDKKLEEETIKEIEMSKKGIVPPSLFVDQLKDETKDKNKLKELGKTRLFCMSPATLTLRMRIFFMHFYAAFMKNRLILHHAVGINPESGEWAGLVHSLKAKNAEYIWTIDYKNFGPGYAFRAGKAGMRAMINWLMRKMNYTPEDERAMWVINEELGHSRHLANNCVFQQSCGSPSGAADTVIKNSLVNMLYVYYYLYKTLYTRWLQTNRVKGNAGGSLYVNDFWSWVFERFYFVTYGDDLIAASSHDILDMVNAVTFSNFYKQFGIVSTDAKKQGEVEAYTTYQHFEFLKRGIMPHPYNNRLYLAPLPDYVVREAAYYIWSGGDIIEDTRTNAGASLVLAYTRGPDFYAKWLQQINDACEDRGIPGFSMSWDNWNDVFYPPEEQSEVVVRVPYPCSYPIIFLETDIAAAREIYETKAAELEALDKALANYDKEPPKVEQWKPNVIFNNKKIRLVIK